MGGWAGEGKEVGVIFMKVDDGGGYRFRRDVGDGGICSGWRGKGLGGT